MFNSFKFIKNTVNDFIDKHPWLTFFTATSALAAVPQTIAAIRGKPLMVIDGNTVQQPEPSKVGRDLSNAKSLFRHT